MFLLVMKMFVNMKMIFVVDNEDVYENDEFVKIIRIFWVVCEEDLNKSSIAGLRPFQNCRQVL